MCIRDRFIDMSVEAPQVFEEPKTLEDHLNKISNPSLRELCLEVISKIKSVGSDVEVQSREYWLGFFYRGRRFATLVPRKSMFHVFVTLGGRPWQEYPKISVRVREDFTQEFFERILQRFREVGGK